MAKTGTFVYQTFSKWPLWVNNFQLSVFFYEILLSIENSIYTEKVVKIEIIYIKS